MSELTVVLKLYRSTLYISLRDANKVANSLFTHQPLAVECPILPTIWFDDEDEDEAVNKYQIILLKKKTHKLFTNVFYASQAQHMARKLEESACKQATLVFA